MIFSWKTEILEEKLPSMLILNKKTFGASCPRITLKKKIGEFI
jgi:hypothetical protein